MNDAAILVEGLTKSFGSVEALKGIDFEVPAGTIFGLLGPNGAGKTTAVRILATILKATGGRAEVLGHDVSRDARAVRHLIGLAGQSAAVDPNLTGRENLRLIGKLAQLHRGDISGRADELLERFDLVEAGDRPIRTYSGGMRRRLDVAAALVGKPPVIFLDEPTTGLDIQSRTELWRVIEELVDEGATVLLTTQYLEEADQLADRIAVVDGGRVVANDTARALKDRLGGTVVEIRMEDEAQAQRAHGIVAGLVPDTAEVEGLTVRFSTNDPTHVLTQSLRGLDVGGLSAAGVSVHEPSLDDVFLSLTGNGSSARRPGMTGKSRAGSSGAGPGPGARPAPAEPVAPVEPVAGNGQRPAGLGSGGSESLHSVIGDLAYRAGTGDVSENLRDAVHAAVAHARQGERIDDRATALLAGYLTLEQRFGRVSDKYGAADAASLLLGAAASRALGRNGQAADVDAETHAFAQETVRILMAGIASDAARVR